MDQSTKQLTLLLNHRQLEEQSQQSKAPQNQLKQRQQPQLRRFIVE
jgi:hypothetical protein